MRGGGYRRPHLKSIGKNAKPGYVVDIIVAVRAYRTVHCIEQGNALSWQVQSVGSLDISKFHTHWRDGQMLLGWYRLISPTPVAHVTGNTNQNTRCIGESN